MKNKPTKEVRPMPDPERSFSWSAISSFEWNKEQWWNKYVLHKDCKYDNPVKGTQAHCAVAGFADPECPVVKKTIELAFGTLVDDKIQKDRTFLPELVRYPILQHEMRTIYNGIPLVGVADAYQPPHYSNFASGRPGINKISPALRDYKTGRRKWDKKRADETGQLTMYCLMLWLIEKIRPEDVELWIDWLPTHVKDGKIEFVPDFEIQSFRTKRTMRQVLEFGQRLIDTHNAMYDYAKNRPILDTHSYDEFYAS